MDCDLGMRCYNNGLFSIYIHNYTHDVITGFHNVTLMPAFFLYRSSTVICTLYKIAACCCSCALVLQCNISSSVILVLQILYTFTSLHGCYSYTCAYRMCKISLKLTSDHRPRCCCNFQVAQLEPNLTSSAHTSVPTMMSPQSWSLSWSSL